jgi:hypothetical protein
VPGEGRRIDAAGARGPVLPPARFARRDQQTAYVPVPVIDNGRPGAGLLAQVVAGNSADHLPLRRLERRSHQLVKLRYFAGLTM